MYIAVPRVRKAVAKHLYMWLLSRQASSPDLTGLNTDAACDVLCESVWDGSLQEVKSAREALYSHLQLQPRLHSVGAAYAEAYKAEGMKAIPPRAYIMANQIFQRRYRPLKWPLSSHVFRRHLII